MDVYGSSTSDHVFQIDDLLDFSNDQIFSSASTSDDALPPHPPLDVTVLPQLPSAASHEFAHDLYFPSDDAAELEWLSRFADDSFADEIPANSLTNAVNAHPDGAFSGKTKVKRSRSVVFPSSAPRYGGDPAAMDEIGRRCTHCASEKTPQWRTGPMGPKTLCNACGVRFKSGRLVPEYRPAASPTFVLTQHSNSHRKVMELRRQKEVRQRQPEPEQMYGHHHHHHRSQQQDFEVC